MQTHKPVLTWAKRGREWTCWLGSAPVADVYALGPRRLSWYSKVLLPGFHPQAETQRHQSAEAAKAVVEFMVAEWFLRAGLVSDVRDAT